MSPISGHNLPKRHAQVTQIADLLTTGTSKLVNLRGIVYDISQIQTFHCKDGFSRQKQNVALIDMSGKTVTIALWSEFASKLDGAEGEAVLLENLQIRDWGGKRQLTTTSNTMMNKNQEDEDIRKLQAWFNETGREVEFGELYVKQN